MTLLEKAKRHIPKRSSRQFAIINKQHKKLVEAFLKREIKITAVSFAAFGESRKTGMMPYTFIIQTMQAMHASGELTIKLK